MLCALFRRMQGMLLQDFKVYKQDTARLQANCSSSST